MCKINIENLLKLEKRELAELLMETMLEWNRTAKLDNKAENNESPKMTMLEQLEQGKEKLGTIYYEAVKGKKARVRLYNDGTAIIMPNSYIHTTERQKADGYSSVMNQYIKGTDLNNYIKTVGEFDGNRTKKLVYIDMVGYTASDFMFGLQDSTVCPAEHLKPKEIELYNNWKAIVRFNNKNRF